jgi:hypothetical protein
MELLDERFLPDTSIKRQILIPQLYRNEYLIKSIEELGAEYYDSEELDTNLGQCITTHVYKLYTPYKLEDGVSYNAILIFDKYDEHLGLWTRSNDATFAVYY